MEFHATNYCLFVRVHYLTNKKSNTTKRCQSLSRKRTSRGQTNIR